MTDKTHLLQLLEPLQTALNLELEGRAFFAEAAATTHSRVARETFEFLAAEEDRHIERIREIYDSLEATGEDNLPEVQPSDASVRLTAFNDTLAKLRDRITSSTTDVEAYRAALAFENGAEDLYHQKAAESTNPTIRKFYEWLIEEEEMHARLLQSCLDFVEDPVAWFQRRKD